MQMYAERWSVLPEEYGDIKDYFKFSVARNPWDRALSFYFSPWRNVSVFNEQDFLQCIKNDMPTLGSKVSRTGSLRSMHRDDVQYFIDFNNLKEGLDHVCDKVGLQKIEHLSRLNHCRTDSKKKDWKSMYSEEMYNAVLNKHREEIEFFNYEF